MVAGAAHGTRHLAVAGVVVAAVAEREAVPGVGAQELGRRRVDKWGERLLSGVGKTTIDALQVSNAGQVAP